jgi:hypothetical protein
MGLSKHEKIRSTRERHFQQQLLSSLSDLQTTPAPGGLAKRFFRRTFKIANSGAFLAFVGILGSFVIFYHNTYVTCVDDSRKFYRDYVALKTEISSRQGDIASSVIGAGSVKMLREALSHTKSFDHQFKDASILELQVQLAEREASIDTRAATSTMAKWLEKVDAYQFQSLFFSGMLDATIQDGDLPVLKELAAAVLQVNLLGFMEDDLRNVVQIECGPANIFSLMWGERPITVRKYDAGSIVEREKIRRQIEAGRNHLTPKTAPPPFPVTTFKAPTAQLE